MTVSIDIGVARKERALTVPAAAMRESGNVRSVQVVRDGRVDSARSNLVCERRPEWRSHREPPKARLCCSAKGIADGARVRPREVEH